MKHLMKFRIASALLAGMLLCQPAFAAEITAAPAAAVQETAAAATPDLSASAVYNAMIAFKSTYPEGTPYTNDNYYDWKGGVFSRGYGCAGFAFMLSDAAFGTLPARKFTDYSTLRVGDLLRTNNDAHFVVVLEIHESNIIVTEGNYGGKVHWGRSIPMSEVFSSSTTYGLTRYPVGYQEPAKDPVFGDVNGNGTVEATDATLALQCAGDLSSGLGTALTAAQRATADVDGSGSVTQKDAQYILIYFGNTNAKIACTWRSLTGNPNAPANSNL